MKISKGARYTTMKSSARRGTALKCMMNKLPTLVELARRRPDLYLMTECQVCQEKIEETQEHLAVCSKQKSLWKRIQKVAIAIAWKGLKEEDRTRVPPYILYTAVYGEIEEDEVQVRQALIRELFLKETQRKILQILGSASGEKFIGTLVQTAWNTFYEQAWRI